LRGSEKKDLWPEGDQRGASPLPIKKEEGSRHKRAKRLCNTGAHEEERCNLRGEKGLETSKVLGQRKSDWGASERGSPQIGQGREKGGIVCGVRKFAVL